jgi:uncharacterized protein
MSKEFAPRRLDIKAFAEAGAALSGVDAVDGFHRLSAELAPEAQGTGAQPVLPSVPVANPANSANPEIPASPAVPPSTARAVRWTAFGDARAGAAGDTVPWLHLDAETVVPLTCQRCLAPVEVGLQVDRWFRFAPDEDIAAAEDEASEEDVLVTSRDFDLHQLIEDELLMEIPVTPRHVVCPEPARLSASDPDFDAAQAERANPFAALGALRGRKPT